MPEAGLAIGIVGCGRIADFHLSALQRVANARVRSCFDRHPERARQLASRYGIPHVARDLDELLRRVDAVLVLTPNDAHLPIVKAAAAAGKAMLVQKPMARGVAEAREMAEIARHSGVLLVPAFMHRFLPESVAAKEFLERGDLGPVRQVWLRNAVPTPGPVSWAGDPERVGGGCIIDIGIHGIDLLRYLLSEITLVFAVAQARESDPPVGGLRSAELVASLVYRLAGGAIAAHEASWIQCKGVERFAAMLYAEAGTVWLRGPLAPLAVARGRPGEDTPWVFPALPQEHLGVREHQAFVDAVLTGSDPAVRVNEAIRDLAVVEAAYASLASGQPQEVLRTDSPEG